MKVLQAVRAGDIGAGAASVPAGAVFILLGLTWCTSGLECLIPYAGAFAVVLGLIFASAWICVQHAHLPSRAAIALATFPFSVLTLMMLAIAPHAKSISGVAFWGVQLCIAIYVAHRATGR